MLRQLSGYLRTCDASLPAVHTTSPASNNQPSGSGCGAGSGRQRAGPAVGAGPAAGAEEQAK